MKWEEIAIEATSIELIDGDRGKNYPKKSEFNERGFCIFLNTGNIKEDRLDLTKCDFINENRDSLLRKGKLSRNDIIITTRGTIGAVALYSNKYPYDHIRINSGMLILRPFGDIDIFFLYQLLKSNFMKQRYMKIASGAAQPQLPIKDFKTIKIPLPHPSIQKKIGSILSAYDDLIENNLRRIELLEQSARELYKEWFVRFKFPGWEKAKFVDGLPEGWERKKLGEVVEITMGQSPKSIYYNTENRGLPFHQGVTNFSFRFVIHNIFSTEGNRIADEGDILCSVRAPVGRLNIAPTKLILGRGLSGIRSKSNNQSFAFYQLQSFFFKENIIGTGAIYASVTKNQMLNIEIVEPVRNIIIQFDGIAKSIDKQIFNLTNDNYLLKQARDLLLPRLMKGEIDV